MFKPLRPLPTDPPRASLTCLGPQLSPDLHFLQLLTPVQAGQLFDLIMRQLPEEETEPSSG